MFFMTGISLSAIFKRLSSTVDGGWSLTLALDASQADELMKLTQFRETLLQVGIVPVPAQHCEPTNDDVKELGI